MTPSGPTPFINPTSIQSMFPAARFTDLGTLLNIVTPTLTFLAVLILGGMLGKAAFTILTAGDDPEKISQAKQTITYSVIGIIIIVSAYFIVKLIGTIFQVDIPL
ncbi:hypothetical protein KAZ66_04305 [Candidatus Woesebacteria bacterium]|nr:hypothetical protein [Candidatus Woesebacteria bacterium]